MNNFIHVASLALCFSSIAASTTNNAHKEVEHLKRTEAVAESAAAYNTGQYTQQAKDQASKTLHKVDGNIAEVKQKATGFFRGIGKGFKKLGRIIKDSTKAVFHKLDRHRNETSLTYKAGKLEQSIENNIHTVGGNTGDKIVQLGETAADIVAERKDSMAYKAGKFEQNVEDKVSDAYHQVRADVAKLAQAAKDKAAGTGQAMKDKLAKAQGKVSDKIKQEEKAAKEKLAKEKAAEAKIAAAHDAIEDEITKLKKIANNNRKKYATAYSSDGLTKTIITNNIKCLKRDSPREFIKTVPDQASSAEEMAREGLIITSMRLEEAILTANIDAEARDWFLAIIKAYPVECATVATIIATTVCTAATSELPVTEATQLAIASAAIMAVALDFTEEHQKSSK